VCFDWVGVLTVQKGKEEKQQQQNEQQQQQLVRYLDWNQPHTNTSTTE